MNLSIIEKKWHKVVTLITPFDLVLFSGSDFVSSTIKKLENKKLKCGEFSHVGIVVNSLVLPHIPELIPDEFYVWESTSSLNIPGMPTEVPDIYGKNKLGVQIRNLKSVFENYKGQVYIGKLIRNPLYSICPLKSMNKTPKEIKIKIEPNNNYFESEIDKIIKEIEDFDLVEFDKIINHSPIECDFDAVLQEINKIQVEEIKDEEKKEKEEKEKEGKDQPKNIKILDEIQRNIEESKKIQKEIEISLDEIFLEYNKMIIEKFQESKEFQEIVQTTKKIEKIYGNRLYNASLLDLFSALYPILRPLRGFKYKLIRGFGKLFKKNKKIKEERLFCSQFVAIIYKELGLIDRNIDVKNFVPVDFLGFDTDGQKNIVANIFKIEKN
jgi:hypothetical protein